jgi:hypothetical protein
MLERVLRTLVETPCIGDIVISIDRPDLLDSFPGIADLRAKQPGQIVVLSSAASPSRSVLEAVDEGSPEQPLLVTTADHALLTVEMVEHFLACAEDQGGDVTVGLVSETTLIARFPESIRTFLPFRGERFSGANLFAFLTPRARKAVQFWTRAESFRKRPWRLVLTFGPLALVLFLLRRLDLTEAFARVSETLGVHVEAVQMPHAEAAIDVDKLEDLELVNKILREQLAERDEARDRGDTDSDGTPGTSASDDARSSAQNSTLPSSTKPPLAAS